MSSTASKPSELCCREVNEFLVAYGDGVLHPQLSAEFEAHLSRCSCCKAYLDQYRTTIALARESEASPCEMAPEELVRMTISFLRERM